MSGDTETGDDVLATCSRCGERVLSVYVDDGRCPDCRED